MNPWNESTWLQRAYTINLVSLLNYPWVILRIIVYTQGPVYGEIFTEHVCGLQGRSTETWQ